MNQFNIKHQRFHYVSKLGIKGKSERDELKKALGYTKEPFESIHIFLANGHKIAIGNHINLSEIGSVQGDFWTEQAIFPIDFDNSPIPLDECLKLLKPLGTPLFYYETWSNNSFRIVYQVSDEQAEFWALLGKSAWEHVQSFWLSLLEYVGDLTNLSVGKTNKGENNYVIDTNIIHKALVLNGTNKTVYADYNSCLPTEIMNDLKARSAVKTKSLNERKVIQQQQEERVKQAFKGQKWTLEQVEARCKEIGLINSMSAWIGTYHSLISGIRSGFAQITEQAATGLFIDFCDNGQDNIKQYEYMRATHKPEKATISIFWGEPKKSKRDYFISKQAERAYKGELKQVEVNTLLDCLNYREEPVNSLQGLSVNEISTIITEAMNNGFQFMRTSEQLGIKKYTQNSIELKGKYLKIENIAHIKNLSGNILLQSFAGTGKTTSLMQLFDEFILLVPTANILKDLKSKNKNNDITFIGGGNRFSPSVYKDAKKLIMTFDQYAKYIQFMINNGFHIIENLLIDECHKLGDYTKIEAEKAMKLQKIHNAFQTNVHKRRIFMSATLYNMPNVFDYVFAFYTPQQRKMKLYQLEQRPHKTKANPSKEFFSAIESGNLVDPDENTLILCDKHISVNEMQLLKENFERFNIKCDLITAENNKSDSQKHILGTDITAQIADVVLASGVLNVGVDIQGKFKHIIILSDDPSFIEQAANRDRQAEYVSIISRNRLNTLKVVKDTLYVSPKGKVTKFIQADPENPVNVKCPYTIRPYFLVSAENIKEYTTEQYKERIGLHNTFDILKAENIFLTDLFYVQSELWNNYIRDNMTVYTLHQHLKTIFVNLDDEIVTLVTEFNEPTETNSTKVTSVLDDEAINNSFKFIISKRSKEDKTTNFRDFFQNYDTLKQSPEYKHIESLSKSIAKAKIINIQTFSDEAKNQPTFEPFKQTLQFIVKYHENPPKSSGKAIQLTATAVFDTFLAKHNECLGTDFNTISKIITPISGQELSAIAKKETLSAIKEVFSNEMTSKVTNKGVINVLLSLGYSVEERRTATDRLTTISK